MSLDGRIALVSGGSRGIGGGISRALAEDGAVVAINYRRDADAASEIVEEIRKAGGQAHAYQGSVDDPQVVQNMVRQIASDLGPIGILVHNAGIASRGRAVADTEPSELQRVMATHALAGHYLSGQVIPGMRSLDRADIVMISSVATRNLNANGAPYNMAKAALEALAFTLAKEERKHGVRVNIVAPGLVDTEMGRRLARATAGVENIRELDAKMPFGRVCTPEDIANVVRYLVSPNNSYVTGEKINVDGGGQSYR